MVANKTALGIFAVAVALTVSGVAPASAEFFGCKEPHTKVTYSRGYVPQRQSSSYDHSYSREYAAPRSRYSSYSSSSHRTYRQQTERW